MFIIIWKVTGRFISLKNITVGSKSPLGVRKAAFHLSCYDPPPFFSSPSTVTIIPTAPAQVPAPVLAAAPARTVMLIACRAPTRTPTHYVCPSLPEALIPVCAILPSHTATSPAP